MDQNTGSFGAAIGGMSPELQAAMQRRPAGAAVPPTSQVSNTAPTADPTTQMPLAPTASAATAGAPQGAPSPTMPFDSSEAKIILSAMGGRLKALNSLINPPKPTGL